PAPAPPACPVPEVVLVRLALLRGHVGLGPVEAPGPVRACGDAVAAADAPVVVDHDDPVRLLPRGADRADLDARRVGALEALGAEIEVPFGRDLVLERGVRVVQVDLAGLHLEDADVLGARPAVEVVLLDARLHAVPEALALRDVEGVAEDDAGLRLRGLDVDLHALLEVGEAFEAPDRFGLFLVGHAPAVAFEVLGPFEELTLPRLVGHGAEGGAGCCGLGAGGHLAEEHAGGAAAVDRLVQGRPAGIRRAGTGSGGGPQSVGLGADGGRGGRSAVGCGEVRETGRVGVEGHRFPFAAGPDLPFQGAFRHGSHAA